MVAWAFSLAAAGLFILTLVSVKRATPPAPSRHDHGFGICLYYLARY
jgi:hypothetical protein